MYLIRLITSANRHWRAEIISAPNTEAETVVYTTAAYCCKMVARIVAEAIREKHFQPVHQG